MRRNPRHLWRDQNGGAPVWVAFIILILFMLGALLYNVHALYSSYFQTRDELSRCMAVTLDANVVNPGLRDAITDVDYQSAMEALEQNLRANGWEREGSGWIKRTGDGTGRRLVDISVHLSGSNLHLTATVELPLPWMLAGRAAAHFPLELYARILYIEP